jgi:membrane protease subunit HflK
MHDDDIGEHFDFKNLALPPRPRGLPANFSRLVLWGAVVLFVIIFLASAIYTVAPEEVGIVLRLGKYVRSTEPGLHFKLPFTIEQAVKVPIQRQLKEEFGFRTLRAGVRSEYTTRGFTGESNMLTGDLNACVTSS